MLALRVRLPALREYVRTVAMALNDWLSTLTPADLERTISTPIGELTIAQVLEVFDLAYPCPLRRDLGAEGLPGVPRVSFLG